MSTGTAPQIRISLAAKLGFAIGLFSVVLCGVAAMTLDRQGGRAVDANTREHMEVLASALEGSFTQFDSERGTHPVADLVAEVGRHPAVAQLQVFDHAFRIRHSLKPEDRGTDIPPELRADTTTSGDRLNIVRHFAARTQCTGCHAGQGTVGGVRIVVERSRIQGALWEFRVLTATTGAFIISAVLLLVIILTRRMVLDPIRSLLHTMSSAEEGDFLVRAPVRADDELGALARAFNTMLAAITDMRARELEAGQSRATEDVERRLGPVLEEKQRIIEAQNAMLQARLRDLQLMQEVASNLTSTLEIEEQLNIISRLLAERLRYQEFTIMLLDRPAGLLRVSAAHGFTDEGSVQSTTFELGEGIAGLVAQTAQPVMVPDTSSDPRYVGKSRVTTPGSLLCVPMLSSGQVMGVINIYKPHVAAFDRAEQELIESVARTAALAIANAQLYESTVAQSLTDALTALPNRRALDARLDLEMARAQRLATSLAVVMVDVDHFKRYNDRFGHLEGDKVLRGVAQVLAQGIRKTDAVARFGGEEFCVLLPGQDAHAAQEVAEKLLRAVRARKFPHVEELDGGCLTVSAGIAVFPAHGNSGAAVLAAADAALYAAKNAGRNCVRVAADQTGAHA